MMVFVGAIEVNALAKRELRRVNQCLWIEKQIFQLRDGHSTTELIAKFIATKELQAIYSHCYRHALNLSRWHD